MVVQSHGEAAADYGSYPPHIGRAVPEGQLAGFQINHDNVVRYDGCDVYREADGR